MPTSPEFTQQAKPSEYDGPLLVNADVVARMMSVSVRTLWRLLRAGQLVTPLRLGRSVRWRKAEIEVWIQDGCPAAVLRRIESKHSAMSATGDPQSKNPAAYQN